MAVRAGGPVLRPALVRHAGPLASPEEAAAYPYSGREREFAQDRFSGQGIGSPELPLSSFPACSSGPRPTS